MIKIRSIFTVSLIVLLQLSCGVPRAIWPQKDIESISLNAPTLDRKLLIASRQSEFKDNVVQQIRAGFENEPVYIKFIGLKDLKEESGSDYTAVVIINTCIAWGLDRFVQAFLKKTSDQSHLIILTTSSNGKWTPKTEEREFDAISSASKIERAREVTESIIQKIRILH